MRGKEKFVYGSTVIHGITPACAGKSELVLLRQGLFEDHPRVCGEKPNFICRWRANSGSPPRVRGKEREREYLCIMIRITPACAGKSTMRKTLEVIYKDHPRVCGEKNPRSGCFSMLLGSPPRVRGKGLSAVIFSHSLRITPACAGKSNRPRNNYNNHRDHPRVCGEKMFSQCVKPLKLGSPPRVRGKAIRSNGFPNRNRITPACAGKRNTLKCIMQ